jgi:DNA primase large subunit
MQTFSRLTKHDYAKYPFLKQATQLMRISNLEIQDLSAPELKRILERAEERLEDAILNNKVTRGRPFNEDIELMSFPVAIMLAIATQNSFIKKRYALAESNQTHEDLKQEPTEKIIAFAHNFQWKLKQNKTPNTPYEYTLNFTDYLRNITHLREKEWKLINRQLSNGEVYLKQSDATRLLKEEVRRHIEKRLETKELPRFPPEINEIAERINKLCEETIGKTTIEEFPKTIQQSAFPPCIKALYEAFSSGRHLSHIGRFTLTCFLVNVGMTPETLIEQFKNFSDYNERMTRYQVEHIAGERGSRTRYTPPRCDTLKTHGVCTNPDDLCRDTKHPLGYYRRKTKSVNNT